MKAKILPSWSTIRRRFFGVALIQLIVGCAAPTPPAKSPSSPTPEEQVAQGERFAREGQSLRAEQYYLSALALGADEEQVFFLLVANCIDSSRLGGALRYVDVRLRQHPEDPRLLRLATSLREALGHQKLAWHHAVELERLTEQSAEEALFLAEFFERVGAPPERSLRQYRVYSEKIPPDRREPWVDAAVRRLEEERAASAQSVEGRGTEESVGAEPARVETVDSESVSAGSAAIEVDQERPEELYEHRN